ncbi:XRE family transcriptional regulator [Paenibacillus larvae]
MKQDVSKYVGNKIKEYRLNRKLTQKELGMRVGVKHNTISSYEKGTNEPEQDMLFSLAKALDVSINDFFPPINESLVTNVPLGSSVYPYYPVSISAGLPLEVESISRLDTETISLPDSIMGRWAGSRDIYCMRVNGESMNKVIPHNSLIAVKNFELSNLANGDIVVYSNGHEYSVKRFYNDEVNKRVIFRPDSTDPSFTDYVVSYEEAKNLKIHGKVVIYVVELS